MPKKKKGKKKKGKGKKEKTLEPPSEFSFMTEEELDARIKEMQVDLNKLQIERNYMQLERVCLSHVLMQLYASFHCG